jgi:hypothetical protein
MSNEPSEKVEPAVQGAVRDVAALWHLFFITNTAFIADRRLLWAQLALLGSALARAVRRESSRGSASELAERVCQSLRDLVVWHGTVATIGERRFQGYDPLLSEPRHQLNDLKQQAEQLIAHYNDTLDFLTWHWGEQGKRGRQPPSPLAWATLAEELQEQVDARVKLLLDLARAEACEMLGEDRRARAFRERHY